MRAKSLFLFNAPLARERFSYQEHEDFLSTESFDVCMRQKNMLVCLPKYDFPTAS